MKKFALVLIPALVLSLGCMKKEVEIVKGKDIAKIAKDIKEGKINPGGEYGMEMDQRWHNIHSEILEIECEKCHIEKYPNDYLYQRRYKVPVRDAPGVVKREICLECHGVKGPAVTKLYGKK